jgi:hypothetical protein
VRAAGDEIGVQFLPRGKVMKKSVKPQPTNEAV